MPCGEGAVGSLYTGIVCEAPEESVLFYRQYKKTKWMDVYPSTLF